MPGRFHKKKPGKVFDKEKTSVSDTGRTRNFRISLQYLDTAQAFASSFRDWQKAGLLSRAMETLQGYCCRPLLEQVDGDKFAIYDSFPPPEKTKFDYPKSVPPDAHWARIHVTGAAVIVGHVVADTFYVVFLDKTHKFYLTKRATGK